MKVNTQKITQYQHAEIKQQGKTNGNVRLTPDLHFMRRAGGRSGLDLTGRKGFTLIELLVVVLIIGILAAVAVPQYQYAVKKARYMQYVTTAEALYKAQVAFKLVNGSYTTDPSVLDVDYNTQKMWCRFTTNGTDTEAPIISCGPTYYDHSLPHYGRWVHDATEPRACFSLNAYPHQAEFCKKITGRNSGGVNGGLTVWRFKDNP